MINVNNIVRKKIVGIGLGPSNLSLAISLFEDQKMFTPDEWLFIEKNKEVSWHPGMLFEGARLQVPFVKDLVTLRNPTSYFSFLNYLKDKGRLDKFINNNHSAPTRIEYEDYLKWVSENLPQQSVKMGAEVLSVEPFYEEGKDIATTLLITYQHEDSINHILTEQLIVGTGGAPKIPNVFRNLNKEQIWHSSSFKNNIKDINLDNKVKVGIIGSGQSAAEIINYLHDLSPNIDMYSIMRRPSFRPEDDSPFVNEVFFPQHVDFMYGLSEEKRQSVLDDYWHANYSAVNIDLINTLYEKLYEDNVKSINRLKILNYQEIITATHNNQIDLVLKNTLNEEVIELNLDLVVLATGYDRVSLPSFLKDLEGDLCYKNENLQLSRNYRVETTDNILAPIYIQGMSESIHGITNTLLSILPIRAGEIVDDLLCNTNAENQHDSSVKQLVMA
ncbi:lysine N(6)-hydroxylase/L-ornithine N(5)-oxygenase family protein (plasmid) [Priestia sp. MF3]|uniref:lysine N(6)-hydroxylase/L-ornithine N(5)-oxygenase family protein n=1 Tax=Priestia sp. MF3 TaxID=3404779 RepID=UPI003BA0D352